jgi:hypothetical protein
VDERGRVDAHGPRPSARKYASSRRRRLTRTAPGTRCPHRGFLLRNHDERSLTEDRRHPRMRRSDRLS